MAQDPPPADQGYSAGATGRPPFGSEPQQPWQSGEYGQQWQESVPPPRAPEAYPGAHPQPGTGHDAGAYDSGAHGGGVYDPSGYGGPSYGQTSFGQDSFGQSPYGEQPYGGQSYGESPYGTPQQYAEPQFGRTFHGTGTAYESGHVYEEQSPYGQYTPYTVQQGGSDQQLYAPPGAERSPDGYVPFTAEPAAADATEGAPEDPDPDADRPLRVGRPTARPADAADPAGDRTRPSLVDKARAAAGAVVSADHAPGRRTLLIRAGAGVAALAVLVAAGLMVRGESGGGGAAAGSSAEKGFTVAHAKVWSAEPAAAQPGADDTLIGGWLLDEGVVRAESTGVHAYDLAAGKPTWSVEPPAAGAVPCGLSPSVNAAGLGAALFRPQADPNSPCTLVVAVDTRTGKTVWTKTLSDAKEKYAARIGVTEDKVIAVGDDKAVAWQSADGADIWQYTGQGKFCTLAGGVGAKTVVLHSSCADSTPVDQAVSLNTADGKVGWWRGLNNQPRTVSVLSAEPAVVATTGAATTDDRIFAWGPAGDPATEIPVVANDTRIDVVHGSFSATPGMYFQDRTMAVTLTPVAGGPVTVAAYDLSTGKQLWKAPTAEKGKVRAVGLDNGALLLAADERLGQPARLSRFALADGTETVGGNFPQGTGSLLIAGRVLLGGGKVIAVPEHSATFGVAAAYQAKG
ncbi:PQQ-binding-like beta-propeller repeat protein [Kitasatospora sp. NBC_00240]|uniref:outer membrane protein assembly factor BamB family protein n=1 Tax=Kitasatospora sp. NBC_00240 TaxID=2903567 RepID=UPI00224CEEB6|nr:PQQ-binding-like beta-propeller repeat protein [Kitasatospora sp. NBC_00240]MCX5210146.1 PQQ-binding-like beta-propeller repeat protein [Kitasatospora sp. NBC_00240]